MSTTKVSLNPKVVVSMIQDRSFTTLCESQGDYPHDDRYMTIGMTVDPRPGESKVPPFIKNS